MFITPLSFSESGRALQQGTFLTKDPESYKQDSAEILAWLS